MNPPTRDMTHLGLKDVQGFVARVLGRAHQAALTLGAPEDAREVLALAHVFADEMERVDADFDRRAFIAAVVETRHDR